MKKVSVFMIAYNHEKFIGKAIEGVVCQKTDFDFELVLGEDFSLDSTRSICERYAAQYPDIINLLPSERNYGVMGNTIRVLNACTGEYIALCEGDDYWTDPNKLQKQIDFLEANPDYSVCFSRVDILDDMGWNLPDGYYFPNPAKDTFTIEDFITSEMNIIPTPTMVLRNVLPRPLPEFYVNTMVGDMGLQLFAALKGKAKRLDEKTAIYRNHAGGVTKSTEKTQLIEAALFKLHNDFNKYTDYKFNSFFRKRFLEDAKVRLIFGARDKKGWARVKHYFNRMPDYLRYTDKLNIKEFLYYHYVLLFPSRIRKKN